MLISRSRGSIINVSFLEDLSLLLLLGLTQNGGTRMPNAFLSLKHYSYKTFMKMKPLEGKFLLEVFS